MSEVTANGVRIHVQHLSTGSPTVVFIHGLMMDNLSSWYYTMAPAMAQRAGVCLYDLRGHGLSECPPTGYSVENQAKDLIGVLDALGLTEPAYLIGNSFGGIVALECALAHPDRVAGLILVEAHIAVAGWRDKMAGGLELAGMVLENDEAQVWLDRVGGRKLKRMARRSEVLLDRTTMVDELLGSPSLTDEQLASITCPVLAIYGDRSDVIGWARDLAKALPTCELHVLPNQSHSVMMDSPAQLRDIVFTWLDRQPAPTHREPVRPAPAPAHSEQRG